MQRLLPWALLLTLGCSSIFEPVERRVVGIIEGLESDEPSVEVPATADAGVEFAVTIVTIWRDGCARRGSVDVQSSGATVTLTPYDLVAQRGECTQAPVRITHTVQHRFAQAGPAEVIVQGRASDGGDVRSIQRAVTVR